MRSKLTTLLIILVFLTGLSLLLYPTISEYWNMLHQSRVITDYTNEVHQAEAARNEELLAQAQDYNRRLASGEATAEELLEEYDAVLDPSGNSIMGYLEIPAIGETLAIAHGTDDDVLRTNVGHIEWSSLPVGGTDTHSVLSGHRGLPSAELLTNLDHVEPGDVFYLHVLDRVMQYRVDQIYIVEPTDTRNLQIEAGQDLVTLVTCTPYGINSHRLLVRGVRVPEGDSIVQGELYIPNEVEEIDVGGFLLPVTLITVATITFVGLLFYRPKEKEEHADETAK